MGIFYQADLIVEMMSHDRASRPSASEILARLDRVTPENQRSSPDSDRFGTSSNEGGGDDDAGADASQAQPTTAELLSIIEDLRRQLAEKDLLIERLIKEKRPTWEPPLLIPDTQKKIQTQREP